jgi:hypothetical protein
MHPTASLPQYVSAVTRATAKACDAAKASVRRNIIDKLEDGTSSGTF